MSKIKVSDHDVGGVAWVVVERHLCITFALVLSLVLLGLLMRSFPDLVGGADVADSQNDGGTVLHNAPEANKEGAAALKGPRVLVAELVSVLGLEVECDAHD